MQSSLQNKTVGPAIPEPENAGAARDLWFLRRYLLQTRDGVASAVKGLSPEQLAFAGGPDGASIAEVVERLATAEEQILQRLSPRPRPSGRCTPAESLRRFLDARAQTLDYLETTPALRRNLADRLAHGGADGYQWLVFAAAHSDRQAQQLRGIASDPAFPPQKSN